MSTLTHYDVIIIGTGPGGGTLAYKLVPSGKKILLLERGGYLPREKYNWSSKTVYIDNKYKARKLGGIRMGTRLILAFTTTSGGIQTNGTWLNSAPLHLSDLRGKVMMVELWTLGCYNCRNVESYVK